MTGGGMARQHNTDNTSTPQGVTAERAARLYHLLKLLGAGPQTRTLLMRRLHLNMRGFYRAWEVLHKAGTPSQLKNRRYVLQGDLDQAIALLPLPDPHLSLGEATQLAKGRSRAHRKLK